LLNDELTNILKKTSGLVDILANALVPFAEKIEAALVFGSVAKGTENLGSDIDILIIGELGYIDAVTALHSTQGILGRHRSCRH